MPRPLIVRHLPLVDYRQCWQAMRTWTDTRDTDTPDELWMVQHPPVFTLGQAGREEHVLAPGQIPLVHCDRGGQVTYHGPGQPVAYVLIDIARLNMGTRALVTAIENAAIAVLDELGIQAHNDAAAPGVYVDNRKIASLGLRIRHGRTYHGLAFNHDMDMEPWGRINPCGHAGQIMTSLALEGVTVTRDDIEDRLSAALAQAFKLEQRLGAMPSWYTPAAGEGSYAAQRANIPA